MLNIKFITIFSIYNIEEFNDLLKKRTCINVSINVF